MTVNVRVVRVDLDEFELSDGRIYPIDPPLAEKMDVEEFQKVYDKSASFIRSCGIIGRNDSDT